MLQNFQNTFYNDLFNQQKFYEVYPNVCVTYIQTKSEAYKHRFSSGMLTETMWGKGGGGRLSSNTAFSPMTDSMSVNANQYLPALTFSCITFPCTK